MHFTTMNRLTYPLRQIYRKEQTLSNVVAHKNLLAKHKTIISFNRTVVTLNIAPKVSLVDERIDITISGLQSQQKGVYLNSLMFRLLIVKDLIYIYLHMYIYSTNSLQKYFNFSNLKGRCNQQNKFNFRIFDSLLCINWWSCWLIKGSANRAPWIWRCKFDGDILVNATTTKFRCSILV